MKVYEAVFKEGQTEGVYALGLVYDPAMQDMFVSLKDEEIKLSMIEEKKMVFGAVLIPNKDILRVDGEGKPFSMRFSEETIEQLAHNWIDKGAHKNFSEQHEKPLEGITAVEMWTVKDPERDTSNYFGKTYPKGTLVAMSKVNNDKTWQDIKEGKINGYSIEAILGLQEIHLSNNLKTEIEMTEDAKKSFLSELKEDIKALFTSHKEEVVEETISEDVETQTQETEVVEEAKPEIDVEALKKELTDTLGVEFKSQLDEVVKSKEKEIENLKVQLAKQPEEEKLTVTPEIVKREVKLNSNNKQIQTTKERAMENIAKALGW